MPFKPKITKKKKDSRYRTLYISEELFQKVDKIARENGTSFNNTVISMLEYCVEMEQRKRQKESTKKRGEAQRNAEKRKGAQRSAKERKEAQRNAEKRKGTRRSAKKCRETQRNAEKRKEAQRNTEKRKGTQRSAKERREAQRSAKKRKETQRSAKERGEAQRSAEKHKEARKTQKTTKKAKRLKKPVFAEKTGFLQYTLYIEKKRQNGLHLVQINLTKIWNKKPENSTNTKAHVFLRLPVIYGIITLA